MTSFTPELKLHHVPAGRRLDFTTQPGRFAYVYRRRDYQEWQCVARNACSPYLDVTFIPADTLTEYVVCYCDAGGNITATTPIVHAQFVDAPLLATGAGTSFSELANV
ncbi:hypothetical protein [Hymenobacter cavernae]|uniref:Uncharacterized protein n=1 Tax=Hymenobacter cavernae TaxID=2044852 RepID=A0ABQ1UTS8_9BACT|nr:hypothetical protein [Hymenobacter cavernae]GGF26844.1 hypothetical protein GCM10011383_43010 [Hymenobacter cavernae]